MCGPTIGLGAGDDRRMILVGDQSGADRGVTPFVRREGAYPPARSYNPQHLARGNFGICNMLEYISRYDHVEKAISEWQRSVRAD